MEKEYWIECFKAGSQTDSSGNTKEWTQADLQAIVDNFTESPVVLGHPKDNAPAYGWVKELKLEGDKLLAKVKPTVKEFYQWVKDGLYRFVSISLLPNLKFNHLGFLGAAAPAVKGLNPVEFSEQDGGYILNYSQPINFMSWRETGYFKDIATIFQNLRDYFISNKMSLEDIDNLIPQWYIDNLKTAQPEKENEHNNQITSLYTEANMPDNASADITALQAENVALKAQLKELSEKVTISFTEAKQSFNAEIAALQEKNKQLEMQNIRTDIISLCKDFARPDEKGNVYILPSEFDDTVNKLFALKTSGLNFSENKSMYDFEVEALKKRTPLQTGETIKLPNGAPNPAVENISFNEKVYTDNEYSRKFDAKIKQYMKDNNIEDYSTAFDELKGAN